MNIAVISTYFNRKNKTIACVKSLYEQSLLKKNKDVVLDIYFCDDGSNDGTSKELCKIYPEINIISGTGRLFWAKGMSKALNEAIKTPHDFYLMVNDDVKFYSNMLEIMVGSYMQVKSDKFMSAVVGSTQECEDGNWTYGGQIWNKRFRHEKYDSVEPGFPCKECNMTNWNCFLIPNIMIQKIGLIDDYYEHAKADNDYSNRIINSGNKIFVAHQYIGTCQRNSIDGTWRDTKLGLKKRLTLVKKPTGLPIKSEIHYCKKFHGNRWPFWVSKRYLWIYVSWLKNLVR